MPTADLLALVPTRLDRSHVHVAAVALMCLLGVWAGLSRRPWYVRAALVGLALLSLLPIRAHEPVIYFLMLTPSAALVCRLLRSRMIPKLPSDEESEPPPQPKPGFRFGLADLLGLTLVVGLSLLLAIEMRRANWQVHYGELLLSTVATVPLVVLAAGAVNQPSWNRMWGWLALAALGTVACAAVHTWIGDWAFMYVHYRFPRSYDTIARLFPILLLWMWPLPGLIALGSLLVVNRSNAPKSRAHVVGQCGALAAFVPALTILGLLYAKMLNPTPWPEEDFPEVNEAPLLYAKIKRFQEVNPQEWAISDLRAMAGREKAAQEIENLSREMMELVERDNVVYFDWRTDRINAYSQIGGNLSIAGARCIGRVWEREADRAASAGNSEGFAKYDLMNIRLGNSLQKRGLSVGSFCGVAVEGMGTFQLIRNRSYLHHEDALWVLQELEDVVAMREPIEVSEQRNAAFEDRQQRWSYLLPRCIDQLNGEEVPPTASYGPALRRVAHRRDVHMALFMTDLAIRCYREKHGRLPQSLDDLSPEFVQALPDDPYSGQPLVYRIEDDKPLLYSVGSDGVDNGGVFGPGVEPNLAPKGRDLDIDTFFRR